MLRRTFRATLVVAMLLALGIVTGAATAVAGTATTTGALRVTVAASGLDSPKHLVSTRQGVLVTESGTGGRRGAGNCVPGPVTGGPGTTQYCEGASGSVALIRGGHARPVLRGLPSVVEQDTGEVAGVSAVAVDGHDRFALLFQDVLVRSNGSNADAGAASRLFGTLQVSGRRSVSIARFDATHPQDRAKLGGLPGETTYDSDPFDAIAYRGGFVVADAAANALLYVGPTGRISLLARFPTQQEIVPAGVLGPAPVTVAAQAVPTSVAVGPDGALYVGQLIGVPSNPGTSRIYRVVPGQAPTVWARGLTSVTAIAFDREGRLLATEFSTGGFLAAAKVPGALVRISRDGRRITRLPVTGLSEPTGVAVAADGSVYVSNHGESSATAAQPGEVLRITGLGR